jgi:signal transduction histidine kinase
MQSKAKSRKLNWRKRLKIDNKHLPYIVGSMVFAVLVYYLPVIAGLFNWNGFADGMNGLHNLAGIDFLGLVFFIPVVYTAYIYGVKPAVITAFVSMLMLLPHALLIDNYPNAFFKPTAFVIILSAVGSVVAMVQRSEMEHRQRMKEMKCLYDIGMAADESESIAQFLETVVDLVPSAMIAESRTSVRITYQDQVYKSPDFSKTSAKITENLIVNGETAGLVEIYSGRSNPYLKKRNHLAKTLVERISGALRQLELEQSLQQYYQQLEQEVEARTRDLEQAREKLIRSERLAAVGELASGVGHELRNPLNVIRNCAYLLSMSLDTEKDAESLASLKVLDKQIDAANKIVTDLLDFTRIKAPTQVIADLNMLINESLNYIELPEKVKLASRLNGHHFQVKTDAEQMERVFTNIMSNAVQAMNGREGELGIDTGSEGGYVWVRFTDNGVGISRENMEKIFEPLFTTKPKGIGLGLAITRRLVDQNGGKIEVTSEEGKGTAFTVKLPQEVRR